MANEFSEIYTALRKEFGYLDWWPGETRDEIIIGAVLTQNTNWKNVEKAIINLRDENMLDLKRLSKAKLTYIQKLIRPSGFYRQKAKRLKGIAKYLFANYDSPDSFFGKDAEDLRKELLQLNGIGMETADSIILYAANKPVFVIDAYTKRILGRFLGRAEEFGYEELQNLISGGITKDLDLYKDFHAQFVELGKNYCRKEPLCGKCPLQESCSFGRQSLGGHVKSAVEL